MEPVVIVGAGISGLTCAFRLKEAGLRPLVLESRDRPGGVLHTVRRDGFLFETGPQCPRFPVALWQLVRDLKLEGEFVAAPRKSKRYLLRHGRLHVAPFSPMGFVCCPLVGWRSKLRILAELFASSSPPDGEETVAEFTKRKFGGDILSNIVEPLVSTVFLGDAYEMGMKSALPSLVSWERQYGSVLRGALRARNSRPLDRALRSGTAQDGKRKTLHVSEALPALGSFRAGMGVLPERLAEELRPCLRYKAKVISINRSTSDRRELPLWHIRLSGEQAIEAEHLVLAVPAHEAAIVLREVEPQLASQLASIPYAPACVAAFAYNRSQVGHALDGFGFMAPRQEAANAICTFWNSSLLPGRAPAGKILITTLARSSGPELLSPMLLKRIEAENSRVLGISGVPIERVCWADGQAMPQYTVGHDERVREIRKTVAATPNLHLAGNYLAGRSIGECVAVADGTASEVAACRKDHRGVVAACSH